MKTITHHQHTVCLYKFMVFGQKLRVKGKVDKNKEPPSANRNNNSNNKQIENCLKHIKIFSKSFLHFLFILITFF